MPHPIITSTEQESAILIGVAGQDQNDREVKEFLNELAFLTETAGAIPIHTFIQRLDTPNPKTYVGSGKLAEIEEYVTKEDIDLVIFDDELSPSQIRNVERVLKRRILDRTNLILDIFAKRAKTAHAKTQVELAQYQYLLPRLTRMWTTWKDRRAELDSVALVKRK